MANDFTIESRTADAIQVRHVRHGHRFTFRVFKQPSGLRVLPGAVIQSNERADLPAELFRKGARALAKFEARKAGLID
jgi:hypothetical protein